MVMGMCPMQENYEDNAFILLHVWGAKKTTNEYLMLSKIFPEFSTNIFRILHKMMNITIWIQVANHSLDQACIYHLRAHHIFEYTAQNNTNFYTFICASGTPSSLKK